MANHGVAALLVASLLAAFTLADARLTAMHHVVGTLLVCNKVYGVLPGDTCYDVMRATGLPMDQLLSFNPNINCQALFVGQWICLGATYV